jgi:hypothetical protein
MTASCSRRGSWVATGKLREGGWNEHLLGGPQEMFGCDMLFSHPDTAGDADPSFIRRAPVELWPAGTAHAKS